MRMLVEAGFRLRGHFPNRETGRTAMRRVSIIGTAALSTMAIAVAAPGIAAEPNLSAPCGNPDTVGGGQPGLSPGPTGDPATALGWDVGSGQCNGSFTVTADPAFPAAGSDGIELGMRAEQRREGQVPRLPFLSSGAGDYQVQTGADNTDPVATNRAWWNVQHSIAYDGVINDLDALIWSIRTDVGANAPSAPQFDMLVLHRRPDREHRAHGNLQRALSDFAEPGVRLLHEPR